MIRRSFVCRLITNPDLHRHAQGTFKDGHHRAAPRPAFREWVDPKSPFYRGWGWVTMPVTRMSLIIGWGITGLLSYYSFCVAYDLRGVYNQVHLLQRQLHLMHGRAEDAERRLKDLGENVVADGNVTNPSIAAAGTSSASASTAAAATSADRRPLAEPDSPTGVVLSHEMELTRERARNSSLTARNGVLVEELAKLRAAHAQLKKQADGHALEVSRLRDLVQRLMTESGATA